MTSHQHCASIYNTWSYQGQPQSCGFCIFCINTQQNILQEPIVSLAKVLVHDSTSSVSAYTSQPARPCFSAHASEKVGFGFSFILPIQLNTTNLTINNQFDNKAPSLVRKASLMDIAIEFESVYSATHCYDISPRLQLLTAQNML